MPAYLPPCPGCPASILTFHPLSLCLYLSPPTSPFPPFPTLHLFPPTFHSVSTSVPSRASKAMSVGTKEPLAAAQPPWRLYALSGPLDYGCQNNYRAFSPSTRVRKQKPPNTDSFGLLELWVWPWYTGSRRVGALGGQLSDPLVPPARLVPRRLASGHGAPVRGAAAAPAEPAHFGQPVGFSWVCTVCV